MIDYYYESVSSSLSGDISFLAENPSITFNEAYPSFLTFVYFGDLTNSYGTHYYKYQNEVVLDGNSQAVLTSVPGGLADSIPGLLGAPIFAFYLVQLDNDTFTKDYITQSPGVCYYCSNTSGVNNEIYWYRINSVDINPDWNIVGSSIVDLDTSSGVGFLVSLGQNLVSISNTLLSLVTFEVAGKPLFYYFVGGGFIIFAGWVIVKWAIPL